MVVQAVVQFAVDKKLERLLDLLEADDGPLVGTSVRIPANLRDAAAVAAEMGLAESTTDVTVRGLRDVLRWFSMRAVLDAHYEEYPEARPELWEIAWAMAELAGDPLAKEKKLIRRAAREVQARRSDPLPEDVLLYAEALVDARQ